MGVDSTEIPFPHEWMLSVFLISQIYYSFSIGLLSFVIMKWWFYTDILTFQGGLNPITGGILLTDEAHHHHLEISIIFFIAGHIYRTNWILGYSIKVILEAHWGIITGKRHKGLYEILTVSWNSHLALNLAFLGSLTNIIRQHIYSIPPYPYLAFDYRTQLSLFTHHIWIGRLCIIGSGSHRAIFNSGL